jgi:anti-sigma factor RsiW
MNQKFQLELQAYLDGELPEREARRMGQHLAQDAAAQALLAELRMTKTALQGNELDRPLPESREFHWSKIRREIERLEGVPAPSLASFWRAWRRLLIPLGAAAVLVMAVAAMKYYDWTPLDMARRHLAEVENHSEHTSSFSFRSHAENLFVVWVSDNTQEEAEEEVEPDMTDLQEAVTQ